MNVSFQISPNPPPIDRIDEFAKILFSVFNEGVNPDLIWKGVFTKPYTQWDDYQLPEMELQNVPLYCDKIVKEDDGQQTVHSYAWRKWGPHATKILAILDKQKETETAGMTEGLQ